MAGDYYDKFLYVNVEATLEQVVGGIIASPEVSQYTSFEVVCEALRTGKLMSFTESRGKSLHEAAAILWEALKEARPQP